MSLASMYAGKREDEDAIREFRAALKRRPKNDGAHRQLASVLGNLGRGDEALDEYQQALGHPAELLPQSLSGSAVLLLSPARTPKPPWRSNGSPRTRAQTASGASSTSGAAYLMNGRQPRALENFERAIKIAPDETAFSNVGAIHYV